MVTFVGRIQIQSQTVTIASGTASPLASSYPDDIDRALESVEATMTSNIERDKAFRRAGLR